jgi:hypothetical protein
MSQSSTPRQRRPARPDLSPTPLANHVGMVTF